MEGCAFAKLALRERQKRRYLTLSFSNKSIFFTGEGVQASSICVYVYACVLSAFFVFDSHLFLPRDEWVSSRLVSRDQPVVLHIYVSPDTAFYRGLDHDYYRTPR